MQENFSMTFCNMNYVLSIRFCRHHNSGLNPRIFCSIERFEKRYCRRPAPGRLFKRLGGLPTTSTSSLHKLSSPNTTIIFSKPPFTLISYCRLQHGWSQKKIHAVLCPRFVCDFQCMWGAGQKVPRENVLNKLG